MPDRRSRHHSPASRRPAIARSAALALVLALVAAGCGDDDADGPGGGLASLITTTTQLSNDDPDPDVEATTTTAAPTTTTTAAPRELTRDELEAVLLLPEDVPEGLVRGDHLDDDSVYETDPPACGEGLSGDTAEITIATSLYDPNSYLSYEAFVDYTPGVVEDLDRYRAAIAGPCSEPFVQHGETEMHMQMALLPDPEVGDDAMAARLDVEWVDQGHAIDAHAYMVFLLVDDVAIQVQLVTADVPSAGFAAAEISLDEVVRVAERIAQRVAALR